MDNEILFTTASLLDFLTQIEELSDKDIIVDENDAAITITIGNSTYSIAKDSAEPVEVEPEVVEEVAEINENTYKELDDVEYSEVGSEDTAEAPEGEVVEGGLIKEALKTLAVGGMVRLTGKLLGKDVADALLKK